MIELIKEMFSYHFMVRAVVVGVLVSLCAARLAYRSCSSAIP